MNIGDKVEVSTSGEVTGITMNLIGKIEYTIRILDGNGEYAGIAILPINSIVQCTPNI